MNRIGARIGFIALLSPLFLSCNGNKSVVTEFPHVAELGAYEDHVLPFSPYSYVQLYKSGDLLIADNLGGEFAFNVYELPDLTEGFRAGRTGRGPNEFVSPPTIISPTPEDGHLEVYMNATKRLMKVGFEDGLMKIVSENTLPVPPGIVGNALARLRDNTYLCLNDHHNDKKSVVLLDDDKQTHEMIVDYPEFMWRHASVTGFPVNVMAMSTIRPKPDGTRFAVFYFYYKYFRLFDGEGNQLKEVRVNIEPFTTYSSRDIVDPSEADLFAAYNAVMSYDSIFASDDYIYAFCRNDKRKGEPAKSDLQVWDWDGNPVALYLFDDLHIYDYLDLKRMKLYSFHFLDEDQDVGAIRVYDLSGLPH